MKHITVIGHSLSSDFVKPSMLRATEDLKMITYTFSATGLPQAYPTCTLRYKQNAWQ
jgi:hypothetical protein